MLGIRNALVAGTMAASALIAPVTLSSHAATAGTVAERSMTTGPVLTSAQKPCSQHKNPAKCRARHGAGHGKSHGHGKGGGLDGGISGGNQPGLGGGGAGIDD